MDSRAIELYQEYAKPLLTQLLKLIKVDRVFVRAEQNTLTDENGERVIDFLGGYGSTLLGHNHPELIACLDEHRKNKTPTLVQASIRKYSGELAARIQSILQTETSETYITHLCNTGTEAVEAGVKHFLMRFAETRFHCLSDLEREYARVYFLNTQDDRLLKIQTAIDSIRKLKPVLYAIQGSYHGKTAGSLALTWNEKFKSMFEDSAIEVEFLNPDDVESCQKKIEQYGWQFETFQFHAAIGILFEPIQCEGGIRLLPARFFEWMKKVRGELKIPLIADEIQTGMYRTGKFLACQWEGFIPDAFLLGKSLGGGLAKISSLSVRRDFYVSDFSLVHSSTFAEDEISSIVALKTIDLIQTLEPSIEVRARTFEDRMVKLAREIQENGKFLKVARGRGFLWGFEFDFKGEQSTPPHFVKMVYDTGFGSYLFMSYLLNQHAIRIGVTLSRSDVVRVEPSCLIQDSEVEQLEKGLKSLCTLIEERKLLRLTRHLWREKLDEKALDFISPPIKRTPPKTGTRTIAFASHLIEDRHILLLDPMFRKLSETERTRFVRKFGEISDSGVYHEQLIQGKNGSEIRLLSVGSFRTTPFFEKSHRAKDQQAILAVREMCDRARNEGADLLGLGQYTSIVTESGLMLRDESISITSGNSLTAGLAYLAIKKLIQERGKDLKKVHIGVIGAGGNICNALTHVLADDVAEMTLVFRNQERLPSESAIRGPRVNLTTEIKDLIHCDAIVLGTNTSEYLLYPEHLKKDAVVVDISVPSNVHPSVLETRKDVTCIQGGLAKLPLEQDLETDWMPLPRGQIYACLAETIVLGLSGHTSHYSLGPISKPQVLDILNRAESVGVTLGALLPLQNRKTLE